MDKFVDAAHTPSKIVIVRFKNLELWHVETRKLNRRTVSSIIRYSGTWNHVGQQPEIKKKWGDTATVLYCRCNQRLQT